MTHNTFQATPFTRPQAVSVSPVLHSICFGLFLIHPILRAGWDLWAQTLIMALWALLAAAGTTIGWVRRWPPVSRETWDKVKGAVPPAIFLLVTSFVSIRISSFPHEVEKRFWVDVSAMAFFLTAAGSNPHGPFSLEKAAAGSGFLAAVFALTTRQIPAVGTMVNPNILAGYLLLTLPLSVHFYLSEEDQKAKLFWGCSFLTQIVCLLLTRSFMGFILLSFIVLFAALTETQKKNRSIPSKRNLSALLIVAAIAVIAAGSIIFRHEWSRMIVWESDRPAWWHSALQMWLDHPVWGVGPGAFAEAFPAYRTDFWGLNSLYAHNVLLEWLAERGIVGTGALFVLLFALFRRVPGRYFSESSERFWGMALLGFMFFNLAHMTYSFPSPYWAFWSVAGLLWARMGKRKTRILKTAFYPGTVRGPFALRKYCPLIGAVLLMGGGMRTAALFRADQFLAKARWAVQKGQMKRAERLIENGLSWNSNEPELYALRAALFASEGDWMNADKNIQKSVSLSPHVWLFQQHAGTIALHRKSWHQAVASFDQAIQALPRNPVGWMGKARALEALGDTQEALTHRDIAQRLLDKTGSGADPLIRMDTYPDISDRPNSP